MMRLLRYLSVFSHEEESSSGKAGSDEAECSIVAANLQMVHLLEQSEPPMPRMRRTAPVSENLSAMGEGFCGRGKCRPVSSLEPICERTQLGLARHLRYLKQ
jgi:hypothetical protein